MLRAGKKLIKTTPKMQAEKNINISKTGSIIFFEDSIDWINTAIETDKFAKLITRIARPNNEIMIGKHPF